MMAVCWLAIAACCFSASCVLRRWLRAGELQLRAVVLASYVTFDEISNIELDENGWSRLIG